MNEKNIPLRKCISCGARKQKREFVMVVRSPKKEEKSFNVLRGYEKKEGRGAYICKNLECVKKARKSRRLERTFKGCMDDKIYNALEMAVSDCE